MDPVPLLVFFFSSSLTIEGDLDHRAAASRAVTMKSDPSLHPPRTHGDAAAAASCGRHPAFANRRIYGTAA